MYHFIVNPNARSGLGQKVWDGLETILRTKQIEYEVHFTKYQKHATMLTKKITSDGNEHTVVALGGDGTVNEVVNGIVDFDKTILGYIPIGSSNDFARGLKLPKEPEKALETILTCPHLHPMNVGELRYKDKLRRFAVSCGLGFDADIVHESVVSPVKYVLNKMKLGKLTYVLVAVHRLFLTTPCTMTITLDNKEKLTFQKAYFVALMNNRYEGGGAMFCPNADNGDDMLDFAVAYDMPKLKVLCMFPTAFVGKHTLFKGVYVGKASQIEIVSENPLPVHTDGEPIFLQNKLSACCATKKIRVITSQSF
ncbi:MAG: diacylglycerol kinase family lipid kinase [Tyzzerella sp.]|nr:diacylglycerol kinase family lipid kinase [Tyzzerella sp.]